MNAFILLTLGCVCIASAVLPATAQTAAATAKNRQQSPYIRIETRAYTLEVPSGWDVSEETPFGQREITPRSSDSGRMTAMTGAGAGRQSWDRLYQTSLFFIGRSFGGKSVTPTPYSLKKTKQGYEAASWSMQDAAKSIVARYVVLKSESGNILALSVKVPASADCASLNTHFDHLVETAIVR